MGRVMNQDLKDRMMNFVTMDENGCWVCSLANLSSGYARISIGGRSCLAHRVMYIIHNGSIPKGMCVLHSCDNPPCVNPAHLHLGTQADNMREKAVRGRAAVGEKNNKARLTAAAVYEIRELLASGVSMYRIAESFSVTRNSIRDIRRGHTWSHLK